MASADIIQEDVAVVKTVLEKKVTGVVLELTITEAKWLKDKTGEMTCGIDGYESDYIYTALCNALDED
jgi:hypothetical protein